MEGAKILVGEQEYDAPTELTHREWGIIKRIAAVRPATFVQALREVDQELLVALAVIVKRRAGETVSDADIDTLLDSKTGHIAPKDPPKGKEKPPVPPSKAPQVAGATTTSSGS